MYSHGVSHASPLDPFLVSGLLLLLLGLAPPLAAGAAATGLAAA